MPRRVKRSDSFPGSDYEPYNRRQRSVNIGARLRDFARRGTLILAVLAGATILMWASLVNNVSVRDSVQSDAIAATAREAIGRHFLWKSLIFLPTGQLARLLSSRYNETVAQVEISKNWLGQGITVIAHDRYPTITWQGPGGRYAVDQTGRIIKAVNSPQKLPLLVDHANISVALNDQVLSKQFVDFMLEVYQGLKPRTGLAPTSAYINNTTSEVFINTTAGFYLRFDTTRPVGEQLDALKVVLAKARAHHNYPQDYVDLRIAYKAYYR